MGLARVLAAMTDVELERLLRARSDLASPTPGSFGELADRAAGAGSVRRAVNGLDRFSYQVLHVCCLLGDGAAVAAVAGLMRTSRGTPPELADVAAAIGRLQALALVHGDGADLHVAGQAREVVGYAAGLGNPAAALLGRKTRTELDRASKLVGVPVRGKKTDQVARLAAELSDTNTVSSLLRRAPAEARELVEDLVARHPVCRLPSDYWYSTYMYGQRSQGHWLGWLLERALIVSVGSGEAELPREVGLALRGGVAVDGVEPHQPAVPCAQADQAAVDASAASRAEAGVRAVAAILGSWGEAPAPALKAGGLGVRELRKAARAGEVDEPGAVRLLEVAEAAGLVAGRSGDDGVRFLPTTTFDDWLAQPPVGRWLALVEAWVATTRDVSAPARLDDDGRPGPVLLAGSVGEPSARRRRRGVLDRMLELGAGERPEPAALLGAAAWAAPAAWGNDPVVVAELGRAVLDEAELLGVTGHGALATSARLLLEGRNDAAVVAAGELLPAPVSAFTLQADLTCVAPGALEAAVADELALMADVESTGAATVYRLGEASLRRAFDAGRSADDVCEFLAAHATRGVPQPLAYLVADSYRRHGRVRVGTVQSFLRSDDAALVSQILRMRRGAALGLRQLAPGVLVASVPARVLLDALRANGFSPVEEDDQGGLVMASRARHRATPPSRRSRLGAPRRDGGNADVAAVVRGLRSGTAADGGGGGSPVARARQQERPPAGARPGWGTEPTLPFAGGRDDEWGVAGSLSLMLGAMVERRLVVVTLGGPFGGEEVEVTIDGMDDLDRIELGLPDGSTLAVDPHYVEDVSLVDDELASLGHEGSR